MSMGPTVKTRLSSRVSVSRLLVAAWLMQAGRLAQSQPRSTLPTSLLPFWQTGPFRVLCRWRCTHGTWAWRSSQRTCYTGLRWACRWGWCRRRYRPKPRRAPGWSQGTCHRSQPWKCSPEPERSTTISIQTAFQSWVSLLEGFVLA